MSPAPWQGLPGPKPKPPWFWDALREYGRRLNTTVKPKPKPAPKQAPQPTDPGRLSPHFHVDEFACKDGTPVPSPAIPALRRLCLEVLEPMRARFGPCHVLSGYRHRAYNARIGGARASQHIYDDTPASVAADVRFARGSVREWHTLASKLLPRGGVGLYVRSGFVHVDNRGYRARWRG